MDSDLQGASDLKAEAAASHKPAASGAPSCDRFYRVRFRISMALFAFVVVVGLPLMSVPSLRYRLKARVDLVREAALGVPRKPLPVVAQVGENRDPFPAEFERPVVTQPQLPGIVLMPGRTFSAHPAYRVLSERKSKDSPEPTGQVLSEPTSGEAAEGSQPGEPEFRQGKMEQEAYAFLLESNATIAGMVRGVNPSLQFKTWATAKTEDDAFLVRLTFLRMPDNTEVVYIWQVKLLSKQVTPLNFNARSLPKP